MPRPAAALETLTVFCAALALYINGACPHIYVGDSGELVAAAATLGIPHPSGYPLFVLLGHGWILLASALGLIVAPGVTPTATGGLPGTVAWGMSLFSALFAAGSVALVFGFLRSRVGRFAALLGAAVLALGPSFWSQANIQRVYSLNAFFVVAVFAAATRWWESRDERWLLFAAFLAGLGTGNHTFVAVEFAALAVWVVATEPKVLASPLRAAQRGAACLAAFCLGLTPYLYLPLRSLQNPRLDWGNPETLENFWKVLARHDFWDRAYMESWADFLPIGMDWGQSLIVESGGLVLLLPLAFRGWRGPAAFGLLVALANFLALALHGSRSDIFLWHRYYIPSYAMVAILVGFAWPALAQSLRQSSLGKTNAFRATVLVATLLMIPTAGLGLQGWRAFDRSSYRIGEDFALAVLESTPDSAHLVATDDNVLFALIYLTLVEARRPDVNLIMQGVGEAPLPDLRFNPDDEALLFTHHPNWDLPGLEIVPTGIVYRAWRRGRADPPPFFPRATQNGDGQLDGESEPRVPKDYLTENLIGHFHYTRAFTLARSDWTRARREFAAAAMAAPRNDVLFYNLGLIYSRYGDFEAAEKAFARSVAINPRHIASASRPRAEEKLHALRAMLEQQKEDPEQAARALAESAARAAKAGRLEEASSLVDAALELAPHLALLHQYRANLRVLRGNEAGAIEAMQRALELDPNNPLYRKNAAALRSAKD